LSHGQRKCANDELLSYFQVEAPIHRPSFFLFFSLTIKDKTQISLTIKILHLGQGSFTRKVRTIFTLKIIISIFVKLFLILVLHLRQFFIVRIFVKRATVFSLVLHVIFPEWLTSGQLYYSDVMILFDLYIIFELFLKL
jgi:hypothetical protein